MGGAPKSPLDYLTAENINTALDAAERLKGLIKSTSNSKITTREKTQGFEFLDMKANAQYTKGMKKHHLELMMKRYLRPFAGANPDLRQVVETMEEFVRDEVEEHQEQFFGLLSKGGQGQTQAIFVYYKLREDGKYNFKRMTFRGTFRLAADLVITHSSKSGFFSSSSKDVINYLPRRGVTAQDIKDLLDIIVPKIATVMSEFAPKS